MLHTELKSASQKIHGILVESIEITDYCFGKPSGLFGSIRKIFKKINFASSSAKIQGLIVNIDFCINGIKTIRVYSSQERDYIDTLISFAESLKKANQDMDIVIQALAHKAEGGKLSHNEYNFLFSQYDNANVKRGQIGEELNVKYKELMKN